MHWLTKECATAFSTADLLAWGITIINVEKGDGLQFASVLNELSDDPACFEQPSSLHHYMTQLRYENVEEPVAEQSAGY